MSVQTLRGTRRSADVVLTNSTGQQLIIEVWYEHRKEVEAVEDYRGARIPALELPVSDDDHDVSSKDLGSLLRERAKWIVEPFEPFESNKPPFSQLLQSHLRARISHEAMQRRGFKLEGQVWERHQSGLTARITDADSYPERVQFEILREGEWRLTVEGDWEYSEEVLDPGARLFKQVEGRLGLFHSGPRIVDWNQHYRPTKNEKGNWTSTTAVPGLRITLFKDWTWRYCIAGDGFQVYSEREFVSPVKARRPAELWARVFNGVVYLPDIWRQQESASSSDDIDTSDVPEIREFSNPLMGVSSGSPNRRAVPTRQSVQGESPDLQRK